MALTPTAYPHGFVCVGPGDGVGVEAIGVVEGFAASYGSKEEIHEWE